MKEFFKNPLVIILLVLLAIGGALTVIGYHFWGWFRKDKNGFPSNAKEGDTFVKDGVMYQYVCHPVMCITTPCPPKMCTWEPVQGRPPVTVSCNQQYQDAEKEFKDSGINCILTSEKWKCGADSSFQVDVNPCVGNILKGKGWTPVATNNTSNNIPTNNGNNDLEVSNPNGAPLYYQSLSQASGGMIYGKSNAVVPFGTKLKMVKFWQTNVSTQPYGGFYETTYRPYVNMNGFFDYKDIKKI